MDQKNYILLKNQLKNAKGAVAESLKNDIINTMDSLFNQVTQLKSDIQAIVQQNAVLMEAKDLTISTQLDLINTQKKLLENQESMFQNQSSNQQQTFSSTNIDTEEERKRRRCIVLARFAESTNTIPSERAAEDTEKVKRLLDEMEVEATVVETFRMGSKKARKDGKETQPRLLKVRLQTSAQAKNILNNAKNIKKSTTFKDQRILIRKSMSAEERNFENEVYQKQKIRVTELQKSNPNSEYVIYARKICVKKNGGKPEKIDDPLNELKFSTSAPSSQQTPIKNQSFRSSSPTPSEKH